MVTKLDGSMESRETSGSRPVTSLSLRCNFSWTLLGKVLGAACQWGMMVVLARLGSPEKVGRFALGFAMTAPVIMFANLHLRAVLATDAKNSHPFGDYLALRSITSVLGLIVIASIALVSRYGHETMLVVLAIGVAKTFESLSDIYCGLLQQHERMDRIAKSGVISGVLSLAALGTAFYFTRSVMWAAMSLMVVGGLVLVFYDMRSPRLVARMMEQMDAQTSCADDFCRQLRPRWHWDSLRKLAVMSLPLGIVMLLVSLNTNIPRYFIGRYLGEAELGIFAAIAYLMAAGSMVTGSLAQSAIPRLAKYYSAGDVAGFEGLLLKLVGLGVLTGASGIAVVAVAGRRLLQLFYGPVYAAHYGMFLWISVASALFYVQWFLGDGMTAARYFKVQPPLLAVVTLATALACWWLIPTHGLMGAAYALLIANALLVIGITCVDIHAISRLKKMHQAN